MEEALDIVMSTPDRLIRNDMATLPRQAASSWVLDLADGCVSARKELASSLRDYHDQVLKLLWPAIEHVLETDLRFRAWQLATNGVAATVDGLHPGIRWRDGVVEVDGPLDADVDLAGRGLQLMPSLWTRPGFTVRWTQPTLVYPLGRFAWMATTATKSHRDPLAAVLGHHSGTGAPRSGRRAHDERTCPPAGDQPGLGVHPRRRPPRCRPCDQPTTGPVSPTHPDQPRRPMDVERPAQRDEGRVTRTCGSARPTGRRPERRRLAAVRVPNVLGGRVLLLPPFWVFAASCGKGVPPLVEAGQGCRGPPPPPPRRGRGDPCRGGAGGPPPPPSGRRSPG